MNKVAKITLAFWVIKICATTLGETGGDVLSMTLNLGYAISTVIFFGLFVLALATQVSSKTYHPFLYWAVILATTTAGTTMSDFLDRTLRLGYVEGSLLLIAALVAILAVWKLLIGSVQFKNITTPRVEIFYWVTILFSNTLGTALGDFVADTSGLGYEGGALVFGGALILIAIAYFKTKISHTLLFWAAFVLTRPLGATLGDELTKPHANGGLNLGTIPSSFVIAALLIGMITLTARRSRATG
ncbi:MAG: COG4705 family protein [Casimicrobiaceae bacterium]